MCVVIPMDPSMQSFSRKCGGNLGASIEIGPQHTTDRPNNHHGSHICSIHASLVSILFWWLRNIGVRMWMCDKVMPAASFTMNFLFCVILTFIRFNSFRSQKKKNLDCFDSVSLGSVALPTGYFIFRSFRFFLFRFRPLNSIWWISFSRRISVSGFSRIESGVRPTPQMRCSILFFLVRSLFRSRVIPNNVIRLYWARTVVVAHTRCIQLDNSKQKKNCVENPKRWSVLWNYFYRVSS